MIAWETALARVVAGIAPVGVVQAGLGEALGHVLAEAPVARVSQPPADVSAMDGFAVAFDELPESGRERLFQLAGTAAAGNPLPRRLASGEAARIYTGAPLPAGADTVIRQEEARLAADESAVALPGGVGQGKAVRPRGLDFRAGDQPLVAGKRLRARDVALAAALDQPWLAVHRRPIVAILAGGDELALPGTPLPEAGLPNSNGPGLAAAVRALGGEPRLVPAPGDSVSATAQVIGAHARGADLLVSAGGASVGGHDLVRPALESLGYDEAFWQVAVRPGKPVFFGQARVGAGLPVLGLPGNPVSALVCAGLFLGPAMARLAGLPADLCTPPPPQHARLAGPLPAEGKRRAFLRARWGAHGDGDHDPLPRVQPLGGQDSSMIAELAQAELLIDRAPEAPAAEAGAIVTARRLGLGAAGL